MAESRDPTAYTLQQRLTDECLRLPAKEISQSTRKLLASWLDLPTEAVNKDYIQQDYKGLAEIMNFDNQEIQFFETKQKTVSLLDAYSLRRGTTVGSLWHVLLELERYDLTEHGTLIGKLEKDTSRFREREMLREENERQVLEDAYKSRPVQVPKVSSFADEADYEKMDNDADEFENMVVEDVNSGQTTYFDAFVSYCHDDFPFVQEMIRMLETVHGLKLCVNARDLLAGASTYFVTARLIADRCRKVILVMSPSFLKSQECEFQVKVALSLSPGAKRKILIPILFRYSKMPLVLQHVCLVDYTKSDLAEWFWGRLAASLKESRRHQRLISPMEMQSLGSLRMDLNVDNKASDRPDINTTNIGNEEGWQLSSGDSSGGDSGEYDPFGARVTQQQAQPRPQDGLFGASPSTQRALTNPGRSSSPYGAVGGATSAVGGATSARGGATSARHRNYSSQDTHPLTDEGFEVINRSHCTDEPDLRSVHSVDFIIEGGNANAGRSLFGANPTASLSRFSQQDGTVSELPDISGLRSASSAVVETYGDFTFGPGNDVENEQEGGEDRIPSGILNLFPNLNPPLKEK